MRESVNQSDLDKKGRSGLILTGRDGQDDYLTLEKSALIFASLPS
jgi:hypothetical protein